MDYFFLYHQLQISQQWGSWKYHAQWLMVLIARLNGENPKLINSLGPVLDLPTSWSLKPPSKQDQLHFVLELVNKLKQGMVPNFNQGAAQCSTHQHRWQVTGLAFSHRWRWWLSGFGHGFPAAGPSKILEPSHLLFWIWDATPSKETKVKAISDIKVGSVRTGTDRHSLLAHSLPVASVLREVSCRWSTLNCVLLTIRPQRKHKIIPGPMFANPP